MPRITNSEQVILFLQNRLQNAGKNKRPIKEKRTSRTSNVQKTPLDRLQSMAKKEDISDKDIKQTLIRGILTQEFGSNVANDPEFQKIIDDVLQAISNDEVGRTLLEQSITEIKTST